MRNDAALARFASVMPASASLAASARMRAAIGLASAGSSSSATALHRFVEERDLRREGVAEEAGDPERHVDARPLELRRAA